MTSIRTALVIALLCLASAPSVRAQSVDAPGANRIDVREPVAVTPGRADETEPGELEKKERAEPLAKDREPGPAVRDGRGKGLPGEGPGGRDRDRKQQPFAPEEPPDVVVPLPVLALTAAIPGDMRVAALPEGTAILSSGEKGDRFVALDRAGKEVSVLFDPGQKVDRWWITADSGRVAWTSGGKLFSTTKGAKAMDDLGAAPSGDIAFSADGARVAFVRAGKIVVRSLTGKDERSFGMDPNLVLGDAVAFSLDGNKVFTLVSSTVPTEPDGIGTLDLTGDAPRVNRVFQAAGVVLRRLRLSPDGVSLAFIQGPRAGQKVEALRVLSTGSGDVMTLARAASIEDPVFDASGAHVYFSGKAANGKWQAWEVGTLADAATGEYPVRKVAEMEGKQLMRPVPASDGKTVWVVVTDGEGKGAQVGYVELH